MSLSVAPKGLTEFDIPGLFDGSVDLLCIRDLQGRFAKLNRAWETALGHPVGELEGAELLPLIHPGDIAPTRLQMAHADLDGAVIGFVNRYRHRDGGYRHLEWRARRIGGVVFGIARDVSDRLAFEAKLCAAADTGRALLADMSRELHASLNGIGDVVGAGAPIAELSAVQQEMVRRITTSRDKLDRLLSALDACRSENVRPAFSLEAFPALGQVRVANGRAAPNGRALPSAVEPRTTPAGMAVASRPNAQSVFRGWAYDKLRHFDVYRAYHRIFRDFPSEIVGCLAIHLDHTRGLHQRGLQALSARTNLISAGRAAALMLRMEDIQFIEPAEAFRAGRPRRYRVLPIMVRAFADRVMVDIRSAALADPALAAQTEGLAHDDRSAGALLATYAELVLETAVGGAVLQRPLNGARLMAMGKLLALSVATEAMERHGETWEGPIEIELAAWARRFEVSRAHVRRVLQALEPLGLARVAGHPNHLLVTGRFRDSLHAHHAVVIMNARRAIDRLQQR